MAPAAINSGEPGFLDDDRTARGEITAAAIAEPSSVQSDILVLCDGEFTFRPPDVIAVKAIVGAQIVGAAEPPAVVHEFFAGRVLLDVGGEFKGFAGPFWGGDESEEFAGLAPQIFF